MTSLFIWVTGLSLLSVNVSAVRQAWSPPRTPQAERYVSPEQAEGRLATQFWICSTPRSKIRQVRCDDGGVDELEGPRAELVIIVEQEKLVHYYGLRHVPPLMDCARMRDQIKKLASQSPAYCIRGQIAGLDKDERSGKIEQGWVFDEFRTPRGHVCWSDDCAK
jgi:hypothetical protein